MTARQYRIEKATPAKLRDLLLYNPETGALTWKRRSPDVFVAGKQSIEAQCNRWNSIFAGKLALTAKSGTGYLNGSVLGHSLSAHRVVWAIVHGEWPVAIDHINGNRTDNRLANLRSVTKRENSKNLSLATNNTSGRVGVTWDRKNIQWCAQIQVGGVMINLGRFDRKDDAIKARSLAESSLGFHANHGKDPSLRTI